MVETNTVNVESTPFETEIIADGGGSGGTGMIYCKIENGTVVDRIIFDAEGMPEDWPDADLFVQNSEAQIGWLFDGTFSIPEENPPDMPLGPYRLYKSKFIERLTNEEAALLDKLLNEEEPKLRLMFNSVEYFVSDDPLFAVMHWKLVETLGSEARADELLEPEE